MAVFSLCCCYTNKIKARPPLFLMAFSRHFCKFSQVSKTAIFPRQNLLSRKQSVCQYCFSTRKKVGLRPSINLGLGLQNLKQYKQSLAAWFLAFPQFSAFVFWENTSFPVAARPKNTEYCTVNTWLKWVVFSAELVRKSKEIRAFQVRPSPH